MLTRTRALRTITLLLVAAAVATVAPRPAVAAARALPDPNQVYVQAVVDLWRGTPSDEQLQAWVDALDAGGRHIDFTRAVVIDPEGYLGFVLPNLYDLVLGRDADEAGLEYWSDAIGSGRIGIFEAVAHFLASKEASGLEGFDDAAFVRAMYGIELGRAKGLEPSDDEVAYWTARVAAVGRLRVALAVLRTKASLAYRVDGWFGVSVGRGPTADDVTFWKKVLLRRGDLELVAQLLASPEAFQWLTRDRSGVRAGSASPLALFDALPAS